MAGGEKGGGEGIAFAVTDSDAVLLSASPKADAHGTSCKLQASYARR